MNVPSNDTNDTLDVYDLTMVDIDGANPELDGRKGKVRAELSGQESESRMATVPGPSADGTVTPDPMGDLSIFIHGVEGLGDLDLSLG